MIRRANSKSTNERNIYDAMAPETKSPVGTTAVIRNYDESGTSDGEHIEVDWTEEEERRLVKRYDTWTQLIMKRILN